MSELYEPTDEQADVVPESDPIDPGDGRDDYPEDFVGPTNGEEN